MKTFTLAIGLVLGSAIGTALAASATPAPVPIIAAADAKTHVGQTVTIELVVEGIHRSATGSDILIDVGGRYPNNAFTAVVFKTDFAKFSDLDAFTGKTVRITGAIKLYRGKPEIVLSDPSQLKLKPRAT